MAGTMEREGSTRRELTKRDRFWLGHLQVIARGSESASEYTRRKGLSVGALYEAKRQLGKRGAWTRAAKSVSFAPVVVRYEPEATGAALRLRLGNGAEFEWSSVPEVEWLAALVERLSARA
jgi:hypothetical protein